MNIRNRIQYLYMTGAVTPTIKLTSNQMLKSYQFRVTHEEILALYRVFFYNSHRVKSSLLSLELSFRSLLQGRQTSK